MIRRTVWAVFSAFVLGAAIAFAVSLLRRPASAPDAGLSGYDAPEPPDGPFAA